MKLKDLKDGMVVKVNCGEIYIVINNRLTNMKSWMLLDNFTDYLDNIYDGDFSMMTISDASNFSGSLKSMFERFDELPILWQKEGYDFKMGDEVQVRDYDEWVNAYYLGKRERTEFKWVVSFKNEFIGRESFEEMFKKGEGTRYKYIRAYKGEDNE